jgi:hypothetical protein
MKTNIVNAMTGTVYVESYAFYFKGIGLTVGYRHPLLYNYRLWSTEGLPFLFLGLDKIALYKMID